MYRVSQMSEETFATEFEEITDVAEDIEILASEGTPVIIVDQLEDLELLGIDPTTITMTE